MKEEFLPTHILQLKYGKVSKEMGILMSNIYAQYIGNIIGCDFMDVPYYKIQTVESASPWGSKPAKGHSALTN